MHGRSEHLDCVLFGTKYSYSEQSYIFCVSYHVVRGKHDSCWYLTHALSKPGSISHIVGQRYNNSQYFVVRSRNHGNMSDATMPHISRLD